MVGAVCLGYNSMLAHISIRLEARNISSLRHTLSRLPYQAYAPPATDLRLNKYSTDLRTLLLGLTSTHVVYAYFYQLFDDLFINPDRCGYDGSKITKSCLI
jgi:hypothetical protein